MDQLLPPPDVMYSAPMRGRLAVMGLQGDTIASLVYGGLPSSPGASEPSGDAGEGIDIPVTITTPAKDSSYSPHPYLPSAQKLDYLQKFSGASLLTLAFGLLLIYAIVRPRRALKLLEGRAGTA